MSQSPRKHLAINFFCFVHVQSVLLVLLGRESNEVAIAGFGILGSAAVAEAEHSVAADEGSTSNQC